MCISLSSEFIFCGNTTLYWAGVFAIYPLLLYINQRISTNRSQMHREALALPTTQRNLTTIVIFQFLQSCISVITVLLITSNNVGIIASTVLGQAVAIYFVFKQQRIDHKHPLKQLAAALRQREKYNGYAQDLKYIKSIIGHKSKENEMRSLSHLGLF